MGASINAGTPNLFINDGNVTSYQTILKWIGNFYLQAISVYVFSCFLCSKGSRHLEKVFLQMPESQNPQVRDPGVHELCQHQARRNPIAIKPSFNHSSVFLDIVFQGFFGSKFTTAYNWICFSYKQMDRRSLNHPRWICAPCSRPTCSMLGFESDIRLGSPGVPRSGINRWCWPFLFRKKRKGWVGA